MTENPVSLEEQPEHLKQLANTYLIEFQQLADQAAQVENYSLQDSCLLLVERLNSLPEQAQILAELLTHLKQWPALVTEYQNNPLLVSDEIIRFLRNPILDLPLTEGEFSMLEIQLASEAIVETEQSIAADNTFAKNDGLDDSSRYAAMLEHISNQALSAGDYGLQDACLLLLDRLNDLPENADNIFTLLDTWPAVVTVYHNNPATGTDEIIQFLRHPDLQLPLSDEELAILKEQLLTRASVVVPQTELLAPANRTLDESDGVMLLDNVISETDPLDLIEQAQLSADSKSIDFNILTVEEEFPFIDAMIELPNDSTTERIDDFINQLQHQIEQALEQGNYGLQDACLLLLERLQNLPDDPAQISTLQTALTAWPEQVAAYLRHPRQTSQQLVEFLRQPALQLALTDDEFAMLEDQLSVAEAPAEIQSETVPSLDDWSAKLQQQVEQALAQDNYGLQDACLLLLERLQNLPDDPAQISALQTALTAWPEQVAAYLHHPRQTSQQLVEFLRQPALQLALTDDEFAMLEDQLSVAEAPAEIQSETVPSLDDWSAELQQQVEQALAQGNYGLQDACLLLLERLQNFPDDPTQISALQTALTAWPEQVAAYLRHPRQTSQQLVEFLRQPALQLALTDDEFAMLEDQLSVAETSQQTEVITPPQPEQPSVATSSPAQPDELALDNYISQLKQQADQACANGYYAMQDACLLLLDRVYDLPKNREQASRILVILDGWPVRVDAYYRNPRIASLHVIKFLRQAELQLPINAEELALLEEQLSIGATAPPVQPPVEETEAPTVMAEELPDMAEIVEDIEESSPLRSNLAALPASVRELLELLVMQTDLIDSSLQELSLMDSDASAEALTEVSDKINCFMMAANTVGFEGLAHIGAHVIANIDIFCRQAADFNKNNLNLLRRWVRELKAYLLVFNENDASQKMLSQLADSRWPQPITDEVAAAVLTQLETASHTVISSQEEPVRNRVATAADVSLTLPSDVNQELLEILLQELPQHTQQFSVTVQRLKNGGTLKDVDVAQRVAHTLKGSANTVGIKGVAVLTHHLEDILLICAKEQQMPGAALCEMLMNAADCLEAMSEALLGMSEAPADALAVLQEVMDWANRIDSEGLSAVNVQTAPARTPRPASETAQTEPEKDAKPDATADPEKAQAATVRITVEQVDNLFRLSSESIILNGQIHERLNQLKAQLQAMETQFSLLQQLGSELDQLIDLKDLSGRSLMTSNSDFDALEMDQYNELHTASRRMVEAAVDAREISQDIHKELEQMGEVTEYQQRLVIDTQEAVMQTRLVPVSSIVPRLQRGIRQTCRLTGKEAELIITGQELMIDGDTLNALVEPLMHTMRNAVDHGIEASAQERLALGKSAAGHVTIAFDREGNNILVRCIDDGRGLDLAKIRETAEKRGLLQPGQEVSEEELKRFILRPNFSTRTETTQTSGRGVGMDVVRVQVTNMGGNLTLDSVFGQGLKVELRVPLPLSRSHALLARVARYQVAIASKGLLQIFYAGDGEMRNMGDEQVLVLDGNIYPVVRLDNLLHVFDPRKSAEHRTHGAILLVSAEDKITAVLVDAITDNRDVVIKSLGHYITKLQGFIGATILGDGSVVPVLDIPELLRSPHQHGSVYEGEVAEQIVDSNHLPVILVVDDSLSNRRSLEQLLSDGGYKVRTARDGIEAIEMIAGIKPCLVLTDLEMPRMNGIELTAHIRTQASTKTLPVIMITSRSTQKHRQLAEEAGVNFYLTKPVREDDLFGKVQLLLEKRLAEVAS